MKIFRRVDLRATTGFTLLETMIAMTIMLIAFTSILSVESSSLNASAKAKQMNVVGMLARNAMILTEMEIKGKKFEEVKKEDSGQFEDPYQDYTWTRTIKEVNFPTINLAGEPDKDKNASQSSAETDKNNSLMEKMSQVTSKYLTKAIREVSIEVKWPRGSGFQTYVVSMYWVDLNSELELN